MGQGPGAEGFEDGDCFEQGLLRFGRETWKQVVVDVDDQVHRGEVSDLLGIRRVSSFLLLVVLESGHHQNAELAVLLDGGANVGVIDPIVISMDGLQYNFQLGRRSLLDQSDAPGGIGSEDDIALDEALGSYEH